MEDVTLSSFRGDKNVVLLFVPLAFTGVCTQELCSIRDNMNAYSTLNAEVLGVSVDSPFSQKEWKAKEGLNFTLLSDFNREVVQNYGASYGDSFPFHGVAKRSAFVVDKAGVIQYVEVLDKASDLPNFEKINEALQGLK